MKKMLNELRYIFNRQQKVRLLLLLVAIAIGTFLELMGVTAVSYTHLDVYKRQEVKILIVRSFPDILNLNAYNVQEIGLARH